MSNYRSAISDAIKTILTGKTIAGDRVFTSLDRKLDPVKDLPAIMVYSQKARRGTDDMGRSVIPRLVDVTIECAVLAPVGTELDAVSEFAASIEELLDANRTLNNTVNNCLWTESVTDVTNHGATTMGAAMISYEVDVFTNVHPFGGSELPDDGFTEPPTLVMSDPDVHSPAFPDGRASMPFDPTNPTDATNPLPPNDVVQCGPNGCDLPAWGGEIVR